MAEINLIKESDFALLKECRLFKNLSADTLKIFCADALTVRYNIGEYIFKEKDISDSMYVILDGEIKISSIAHDKEVIFANLKKGDFFGEIAMLTKQMRLTDAISEKPAYLLMLTNENFEGIKSKHPDILADVYKEMLIIVCHRLKITDQKILIKTIFRG